MGYAFDTQAYSPAGAPSAAAGQGQALSGKNLLEKMRSVRVELGPRLKDVQVFTKQLAVMLKAGINIRDAIDAGILTQDGNLPQVRLPFIRFLSFQGTLKYCLRITPGINLPRQRYLLQYKKLPLFQGGAFL